MINAFFSLCEKFCKHVRGELFGPWGMNWSTLGDKVVGDELLVGQNNCKPLGIGGAYCTGQKCLASMYNLSGHCGLAVQETST